MTGDITSFSSGRPGSTPSPDDPGSWRAFTDAAGLRPSQGPSLPLTDDSLGAAINRGQTLSVEGTNVVRVPFGIRQPRRARPARPDHWATLVLPFQPGSTPTPPPRAA